MRVIAEPKEPKEPKEPVAPPDVDTFEETRVLQRKLLRDLGLFVGNAVFLSTLLATFVGLWALALALLSVVGLLWWQRSAYALLYTRGRLDECIYYEKKFEEFRKLFMRP